MTQEIGSPKTRYYDVETNYLLGEEYDMVAPLGKTPPRIVKTLGDYRPFGGIILPTRQTEKMQGYEVDLTIEDVAINVNIPQEQFDLPSAVKILQVGLPRYLK